MLARSQIPRSDCLESQEGQRKLLTAQCVGQSNSAEYPLVNR
jgi:hypothetical protein